MHLTRSVFVFATLLATVVNAAECANYDSDMVPFMRLYESTLWSLRQRMCGNDECGNSQSCTLYANNKDGGASLYRKDVQYEYPNCWVCTELHLLFLSFTKGTTGRFTLKNKLTGIRMLLRISLHSVIEIIGRMDGGN